MIDRSVLAASDSHVVTAATGLLSVFNDAGVLGPLDVASAEVICRLLGETDGQVRLAAGLAVRGTRLGHVCIRLDTIRQAVVVDGAEPESIDALPWPEPDAWQSAVEESRLVGDGDGDHPLVLADGRIYLERYFRYEERLAKMILDRCGRPPKPLTESMEAMLDRLLDTDSNRQRRAATVALTRCFAVISGGPGTGKTHTVGAVLAGLAADGPESFPSVALCAPTGKAAARLGETIARAVEAVDEPVRRMVTSVTPSTIHRLLGWRWGRGSFVHDEDHRLPHDLVVVDEMSMVSLPMAAKLLSAIKDDASVVLVGDPYQLESIEAGTVLTDIVSPSSSTDAQAPIAGHIVELDRLHRYVPGGPVAEFADTVRSGDADHALELLAAGHDALRWIPDRSAPSFAELWERVIDSRSEAVRHASNPSDPTAALEALNQVAVLCARRRGPESVAAWGRDIEAGLDQRFVGLRYGGVWYPGRPVMITSNDYRLELFNGDIGVTVDTDDGMRVVFERGGVRAYPLARLGEHATVHAMTIHKSQGSQFEEVVVVLPDEASRLLTRELLYTAVTRATTRVWLVGEDHVVRQAINRSVERASGLGGRLWISGSDVHLERQKPAPRS